MAAVVVRNWTFEETNVLLEILKEQDIFRRMDQRKVRHSDLLKDVHQKFKDAGYSCSIEQMKNRWKVLKASYHKAKQAVDRSGAAPTNFPFFEKINSFIGGRPIFNVEENGVDIGFRTDEDVNVTSSGKLSPLL